MTDTKEFDVVRVARSDGADTGPGYWPAPPPPTAKKSGKETPTAEKAPRSKPQMLRLADDDPRFVEWRVKLGILLKQELSPSPDEGSPWYVQFPRGYWLYERSKHLWVSGYPIKAKLFKTPQEFAVHLIWLLSSSRNYRDCCCVHCNAPSPAKLASATEDTLIISHEEPTKIDKAPPKMTPVPIPTIPGQPSQKQAVVTSKPESARSTPPVVTQKPPTPVQPKPQSLARQVQLQPQPQPQPQPQVQNLSPVQMQPQAQAQAQAQAQPQPQPQPVPWALNSDLLFRTGELLWYQNGTTWRLGVVAASGNGRYELSPIGHGMVPQPNVTKTAGDMRPFHAFTVPPVGIADLKDKLFDEVAWKTKFSDTGNDTARRDLLALDASKMAAIKVDHSYSLWSPLSEDTNAKSITYYGAFLGAERIELGDCLRLRSLPPEFNVSSDSAVLGLRYIFISKDYPGAVFFRGHVYQNLPANADASAAVRDEHLPSALRNESQWRNSVAPSKPWRWRLVRENVLLKEQTIRGRFYPTNHLLPILNPEGFRSAVANGQIDDLYAHLNNRMEGAGRYVGRKRNRLDLLGASVAPTTRLALEPYVREEPAGDVSATTEA